MEKKMYPPNFPVYSLSATFVNIMNKFGRLHEPRLPVRYLIKTNPSKLFSFVPLGLRMAKKKRIGYRAVKIKDIEGLKRIISKAEQMDSPIGLHEALYKKGTVGYSAVAKETILESKK